MTSTVIPSLDGTIDWDQWRPTEEAVLCFVHKGDQILLIRKKRGLGAGKINGPGGRIDPGETALQAAIRETQEEIGVTPIDPQEIGELLFAFRDGYSLKCHVFASEDAEGTLTETDEAIPFWCATSEIPFHEMWADDEYWMPMFLRREPFLGRFCFDDDRMLSHEILAR